MQPVLTSTADIYSFGIIMYEFISGLPPYHNISHDINLAMKICQGLRPSCLDANPLNRPLVREIEANEINDKLQTNVPSTNLSYETHSEAIYTSRLLNFNNLLNLVL
ncbi:hypothetical protein C1645_824499 [Glomus cerebriforme]|uniref:Uncharacterized protein n=1 Tax=Glomus cerebriforme TaxID=658196 RepID=A0A397T3N8_9GLOM|nr:hypothetical protein C1645_824499 [Glomus cerebriforme]